MKKGHITFLTILDAALYFTLFILIYKVLFSGVVQGSILVTYVAVCIVLLFLLSCFSNFVLRSIVDYKKNGEVRFNKYFFDTLLYHVVLDLIFHAILLFLVIKFDVFIAYIPIMFMKMKPTKKVIFTLIYFIISFWISISNLKYWLKKEPD